MAQTPELQEIQGLIMSGHKHLRHAKYLFLQIDPANLAGAKAWLTALIPQIATSIPWEEDPLTQERKKPPYILNLGISYSGLAALGLPEDALKTFPDDFTDGITSEMRSRILGDHGRSAPEHWEIGRDPSVLHLLLVILALDEVLLQEQYAQQKADWEAHGLILLAEETGHLLPGNREHFGFLDGVSQPDIKYGVRDPKASEPKIAAGEFILGYPNQYDQLPV
jgi:deferrochelatase/peroxidase EfeB